MQATQTPDFAASLAGIQAAIADIQALPFIASQQAPEVIDELADINAEIEKLETKAAALKARLASFGAGTYKSEFYKAVVTVVDETASTNWQKVAKQLQDKVSVQAWTAALAKGAGTKAGYTRVSLYDL